MKLKDISGYPLMCGDYLILVDAEKEEKHKLQINHITELNDNMRLVRAVVVESNNPNYTKNKEIEFRLDRSVPVMGVVIKPNTEGNKAELSTPQLNAAIAIELKKFLDNREQNNYGAPLKLARNYLTKLGLFDGVSEKRDHNKLIRMIRNRKDWFHSTGGYVFSVEDTSVTPDKAGVTSANQVKIVDWQQCKIMLKALLRSGLIGDVHIIHDDE
jgi:hypothetical protein